MVIIDMRLECSWDLIILGFILLFVGSLTFCLFIKGFYYIFLLIIKKFKLSGRLSNDSSTYHKVKGVSYIVDPFYDPRAEEDQVVPEKTEVEVWKIIEKPENIGDQQVPEVSTPTDENNSRGQSQ